MRRVIIAMLSLSMLISFRGAPGAQQVSDFDDQRLSISEAAQIEAGFREMIGFNSDLQYVQRLMDDPELYRAAPTERGWGYHFTPDELDAFDRRVALQSSAIDIAHRLEDEQGAIFAGSLLEHAGGGRLIIGVKEGQGVDVAELQELSSEPRLTEVRAVPFSRAELTAAISALFDAGEELHESGVMMVSATHDFSTGTVILGLGRADDQSIPAMNDDAERQRREEVVREMLPAELREVNIEFEEAEAAPTADSRASYDPPLRGGIHLYMQRPDHDNGNCTSGFVVYRPNISGGTQWGLLTAGHCGYATTVVRWGNSANSQAVGNITLSSWYVSGAKWTDSAYLNINSALRSRWIYHDLNRRAWQIHRSIQPVEGDGFMVCMSGRVNPGASAASNCGTIANASVNYYVAAFCAGTPQRCHQVRDFVNVSRSSSAMMCHPGDSGAPVFAGPEAWGIHYGHFQPFGACYYSRIAYALSFHNLTDVEHRAI